MIFQSGQHVKCVLRNGAMAEGIVEESINNIVQLRSLDDESIIIIPHPDQDIVLVKIILEKEKASEEQDTTIKSNIEDARQEITNLPVEDPMRLKKLSELKIMLMQQEKKVISEKLKDHTIGAIKKVQYGQPQFFTKPSTK